MFKVPSIDQSVNRLHSQSLGSGPDLVILHGLFGSGDNWRSLAKRLESHYRVHLLDLPNHGRSPWSPIHTYASLAESVQVWVAANGIETYDLIGHSMGGKVAMQMAMTPAMAAIERLIIVDIAPRTYPAQHNDIFNALSHLEVSQYPDRASIGHALAHDIETNDIRQFLLKSLYRDQNGDFAWRFNWPVLKKEYPNISAAPDLGSLYAKPTLFIKGENSSYIEPSDSHLIQQYFPQSTIQPIAQAGHWPHAEQPTRFQSLIDAFLKDC